MNIAVIRRVREPFGILGNMSAHPVLHEGLTWPTSEALFQALRFATGDPIREEIRSLRNPMKAKFCAKAARSRMYIEQLGSLDLDNMRLCLALKYAQHQDVRDCLASTGNGPIVEDCTKRQRGSGLFWGAALIDGQWSGRNWLGRLWMELRTREGLDASPCAQCGRDVEEPRRCFVTPTCYSCLPPPPPLPKVVPFGE